MKTHLRIGAAIGMFLTNIPMILAQDPGAPADAGVGGIPLLEPIGGFDRIPDGMTGLNAFFFYFNSLYPWMIGTAAGICVLMALVGGIQMIISGGDTAARGEGLNRFLWSVAGILILVFMNLILRLLNPSFYQ